LSCRMVWARPFAVLLALELARWRYIYLVIVIV
jgi:hypothetical protein